jgi:hypothetical protein
MTKTIFAAAALFALTVTVTGVNPSLLPAAYACVTSNC